MLTLTVCAAAFAGFAALSLAMSRHSRDVLGDAVLSHKQRTSLRIAGVSLLGVALVACIAQWGLSVGVVALCGVMTLSAMGIVLLLTYAPQTLVRTSVAAVIVSGCSLLFAVAV